MITEPQKKYKSLYTGPTAENCAALPAALLPLQQWVLWRGADRVDTKTGEVKLNKIPIDPQTLRNADTTDPVTWGTFEACIKALPVALEEWEEDNPDAFRGGGIGFVFTETDPYCGIDLDGCVDPATGTIVEWARKHVGALRSYTERTPSGTGLHILVQGTLPPHGRKKGKVEAYEYARFFTMTGWQVPETPRTIEPRQEALTAFHEAIFGAAQACDPVTATPPSPSLEDGAILEKARAAKNAPKFARLWSGDTSMHEGNDSGADMGLCSMLAFWTQDPAQIDRLFRQSGLMREKWDERRGELLYGARTIREALARQTEHYRPRRDHTQDMHRRRNGHGTPPPHEPEVPAFDLQDFLSKLAASEPGERLKAIFDALSALAALPLVEWITAKRSIKTCAPELSLNDLERLRTEARQMARTQAQAAAMANRPAWQQGLFYTRDGDVLETDNNLQAIFANHAAWQGRLWWDTVANKAYLDETQPLDIHYVRNEVIPWLGMAMRMPVRHSSRVLEVMRSWAQCSPRDPIQEWLQTLPERDSADSKRDLLNTWLHKYAGAEDTPYTRFVSRILIVSLVKRAMAPGVQYRYVVVLEGEENVGKTRLLRLLGNRWHQEFPKSVEGREAYMQLQGYWLVELGELDALRPAEETRVKMFISQQMDIWVPKYENDPIERPRRAILVGTTNEREYLKGIHGNTRYLPLWLDGPIQHDKIAAVRDRLFTQAKHFLLDHADDWWCIPVDVEEEVEREREARRQPALFEDKLRLFLLSRDECTVAEALEYLQIPKDRWSKALEMDVTKSFKALKWYRHIERDSSTKQVRRFWADTPQEKKRVPF